MVGSRLPVGTCGHSVPINQHEALMNLSSNPGSRSHVISYTSYGSHPHLLKGFFFLKRRKDRIERSVQPHPVTLNINGFLFSDVLAVHAEPRPASPEPSTYLEVIQAKVDIFAHLEESRSTRLVQQDVDGDFAIGTRLLKILKDIQVRQRVCNYGNHLQWKITENIIEFLLGLQCRCST